MERMSVSVKAAEPVEGTEGETLGYIGHDRSGPGWWPLDDRQEVVKGCVKPMTRREAAAAVAEEALRELLAREHHKLGLVTPSGNGAPVKPQQARHVKMLPVRSSFIKALGYGAANETALVAFKSGGVFSYPGVTAGTFGRWLKAPSKGKFFHRNIRARINRV